MTDNGMPGPDQRGASSQIVSLAMLFVAGIAIGSLYTINKVVAASGIPFVTYIVWQGLGAALLLTAMSLALGKRIDVAAPLLRFYVVFGLIGFAVPILIFNLVAPSLPAGLVSLITPLIPMLTYACSIMFRIETLKTIRLAGLLLGLAGVMVVVLPEAEPAFTRHDDGVPDPDAGAGQQRLQQRRRGHDAATRDDVVFHGGGRPVRRRPVLAPLPRPR